MKAFADPWRAAALAVVALALAARLPSLTDRSLWFDEAFSWQLTRFGWSEMFQRAGQDVHPPAYYVALKLWTAAFGDSVTAMRLMSLAWFALALVLAYRLCREMAVVPAASDITPAAPPGRDEVNASRDAGVIATLLLATSPFLDRYSQEVRMYAQEILLLLLSNWLLLRALRSGRGAAGWWLAYALAAAALGFTHYFGLFSLVAQGVFVLGLLIAPRSAAARRNLAYALGSGLLIASLYAPWVPTLLRQQKQVEKDYWVHKVGERSPLSPALWGAVATKSVMYTRADQVTPLEQCDPPPAAVGYSLLAGAALTLAILAWRGGRVAWLLVSGVVIPVNLAIFQSYRIERNLIEHRFLMPSFVMTLLGLSVALGGLRPRAARWTVAAAAAANLIMFSHEYVVSMGLPQRGEYRVAADRIALMYRAGDAVVCGAPASFFPMKYHAGGRFPVYQSRPPGEVFNHYTGGPILTDADYLAWDESAWNRPGRVWLLGVENELAGMRPKAGWNRVEWLTLPEAIFWRGQGMLELWEPTPTSTSTSTSTGCLSRFWQRVNSASKTPLLQLQRPRLPIRPAERHARPSRGLPSASTSPDRLATAQPQCVVQPLLATREIIRRRPQRRPVTTGRHL